ncbi:MAG: ATP-dependent metallopeptidase FtsH/Yme1/Tma family protein, partial [Lysobacteraceae bacterium]
MNDLAKNLLLWVVIAVVLMAVFQSFSPRTAGTQRLNYDEFIVQVKRDAVARVKIDEDRVTIRGERRDGSRFETINPGDRDLVNDLINHNVTIEQAPPASGPSLTYILINLLPYIIFIGIFIFFMRQLQSGGGGRGAMSFGRSRAKLLAEDQIKVTFA